MQVTSGELARAISPEAGFAAELPDLVNDFETSFQRI